MIIGGTYEHHKKVKKIFQKKKYKKVEKSEINFFLKKRKNLRRQTKKFISAIENIFVGERKSTNGKRKSTNETEKFMPNLRKDQNEGLWY